MKREKKYIFTSQSLGFRDWTDTDRDGFAAMNSDPETMRFFPALLNREQSDRIIEGFKAEFRQMGFTYFAVETLEEGDFIGFIGLHIQTFESDFTPFLDIGWRLDRRFWNRGYATEGAKRCLQFGFGELGLEKILAIAPKVNEPSVNVMKKIGMKKIMDFEHPLLLANPYLIDCEMFGIDRSNYYQLHQDSPSGLRDKRSNRL